MLTRRMPLYTMEMNSHFTFLQGITINVGIITRIDRNLSGTYLVNKGYKSRNWGNNTWVHCTQRENFSELSPLAESN